MPNEAFTWMGRVKAVEREYRVIRFGTDRLLIAVNENPVLLEKPLRRPDIHTASNHLESTYIIRIFSEFETALQLFTRAFHIKKPRGAEQLVNRVRDRGHIPQPVTDDVHRVRDYRNAVVHARSLPVASVTIRDGD